MEDMPDARPGTQYYPNNNQGFLPVEGGGSTMTFGTSIRRVPLCRGEEQITRNYCLFWKKDNSGYYVEEFADILKSKFE